MDHIKSLALLDQRLDLSGLRYNKIRPTDIDGLIDFQGEGFALIEIKYFNQYKSIKEIVYSPQIWALERLIDSLQKPSIFILGFHNTPSPEVINAATCRALAVRFKREWKYYDESKYSVKEVIDLFLTKVLKITDLSSDTNKT